MDANPNAVRLEQEGDRELDYMQRAHANVAKLPRAAKAPSGVARTAPTGIAITDSDGKPRKQADILVDIGRTHELFHDPGKTAYAKVGLRVFPIDSRDYRETLLRGIYNLTNKGANRNSLGDAIATIAAHAKFSGACHPVRLRIAEHGDVIVIDKDGSTVIVISAAGIREQVDPLVHLRRIDGMLSLPNLAEPDFDRVWKYFNVCVEHRPLVAGFMLASLRPLGPHPILFLEGEQGSGKSTAARVLRRLIDPSAAPLRAPPRELRDLLVGALNGWLLALDNLSHIPPEMSDALCRLATGGAISERTLYTNTEEVLIEVQRPVIVNGIESLPTRPDLADRGLLVELDVIECRQDEATFWREFEADAPAIFAGLLHGVVAAIQHHRTIAIGPLPRMADFAMWAAAGMEPLGFTAETFMATYRANLETGLSAGIEASAVGRAVLNFMRTRESWHGTAGDLLAALGTVEESELRSQAWPKSPRGLSGAIRRLAPALRHAGVEVTTDRASDRNRTRTVRLCRRVKQPSISSASPVSLGPSDGLDDPDDQNRAPHTGVEELIL